MKKALITAFSIIAFLAVTVTELPAQQGMGKGRYIADRNYNPATVETVKGTVTDISTAGTWGIHITVKTEKETIGVHLGPEWFLKNKITIAKGDSITVVGSRVKQDGKDVIIAKTIQKNGTTVVLRDDNGVPGWAGQGKRGR